MDVDDVLRAYMRGMIAKYGWPPRWGKTLNDMYRGVVNFGDHFKAIRHSTFLLALEAMEGAQLGTHTIHAHPEYNLEYVTATPPGGMEEVVTKKWLLARGFPPVKITFCKSHAAKVNYLAENSKYKDIVVDDYVEILTPMYELAVPVVVAFDAPWNRGVKTHRRVKTWEEFTAWFTDLKEMLRYED